LCQPDQFNFSATNTENVVDYYWEWGDGTSVHDGKEASHTYPKEGHYTVQLTATTDKKCINTIQKENVLYVAPVPTVDFSIWDNTCLELGPQSLSYTGSADERDHYKWDLSTLLPNELITIPGDSKGPLVFELLEKPKTEIRLQVTSKYGCISENKALILKRIPKFSIQLPDSSGCIPYEAQLEALTGDKIDVVDYSWKFGDGKSGSGSSVKNIYRVPDKTFDVTLFAASGTTGCKDTLFKPGLITVFPQPKALFSVNSNILTNENPVAVFTNQSQGADHYLWSFGDGFISRSTDPTHKYEAVGPRRVLLESMNSFECSDTISSEILVALSRIFTPNAFSPDAPGQVDREFFPFCNGVIEKGYHLKILSRWNEVVFETTDKLKGWDGHLSDGSMAPTGNYVWILSFVDFMGERHHQNGTVALIF